MSRKELTVEERKIILNLHVKERKSYAEIAKIMSRSRSTIQHVIGRFKNEGRIENTRRSGRPPKLNDRDKRTIKHIVDKEPFQSAVKISEVVKTTLDKDVHPETIRRTIKEFGFGSYTPRKKPHVSKKNRLQRLEFAKTYKSHPVEFWRNDIFTDESKYNIFGSDGRFKFWRRPGDAYKPKYTIKTVKHGGGGVMVWGCMGSAGVGNMEFIDGIMDHKMYIEILKRNLKESADKLGIGSSFYFYQDNDPKHTALNTRLWLLYNVPHLLKPPPQSPDLNPIEHVWNQLEKNIRGREIRKKTDLKAALQEEWNKMDPSYLEALVSSMPRRLNEVIKMKGYPTKY